MFREETSRHVSHITSTLRPAAVRNLHQSQDRQVARLDAPETLLVQADKVIE
jgi:hypothetical protein